MKTRLASLALALLALGGCMSGVSPYRYWNQYELVSPAPAAAKRYTDENLDINFWLDEKRIHFMLKNLSGQPLTLDWSRAEYLHTDGGRHQAANMDSLFTPGRGAPPPKTLAPGQEIRDFAAPARNVEELETWTWYLYPLFNLFDDRAYDNKGKTFGLDIPVQARGEWKTYHFRFVIQNVAPRQELL